MISESVKTGGKTVIDQIPSDFPRRVVHSSLSGAMPKLSVRLTAAGTYTNAVSDEEYLLAYENAEALAQYLKSYVLEKEHEHPNSDRQDMLDRIKIAVNDKFKSGTWDIEPAEQAWVMKRLKALLA